MFFISKVSVQNKLNSVLDKPRAENAFFNVEAVCRNKPEWNIVQHALFCVNRKHFQTKIVEKTCSWQPSLETDQNLQDFEMPGKKNSIC